ncbi:MAG: NAD(P)H-binding protein [Steroidobacteraceae bacterium]
MSNVLKRAFGALAMLLCVGYATMAGAAASNDRIIVSGASGQLGGLVIKELLARGVPAKNLILVSHTPDKLADYARQGASVRFGDVNKPESLADAYAGGTRMLMISIGLGEKTPRPQLHKRAFDAAVKAGVKHIVYTSFLGADVSQSPLAVDHRASEANLKASGAKWTMLRNGVYAEFTVLGAAQRMVSSGKVTVAANEMPSAPVTREDCAAAAAGALLNPAAEDQAYDITGPALITTTDIARVASEVTGRKIDVSIGQPGTDGGGLGMTVPTSEQIAQNIRNFKMLTGREPTSLRQLLEANKAQLLK